MNNILVLTYWSYSDALIQTYTLPYVRMIRKNQPKGSLVYLVSLEKAELAFTASSREMVETLLRSEGIVWLPFAYQPFGIRAFFMSLNILLSLTRRIYQGKISVIHCWATPAGAFGYLLSIMTGRRLVIDSYEPHAESMVENGTWKKGSFAFMLLFWLEKRQTHKARALISATEGMRSYAKEKYGVNLQKFWVKPACVDLGLFSHDKLKNPELLNELNLTGKIICVYAGKLGGIYLENETFDFFKAAHDYWGDRFRVLLLSAHTKAEIEQYCKNSKLDPSVVTLVFVPHARVPDYMGLGDFAITPVKPVPTKRFCTPIKDGEYWALGLPVVIPAHISDDSEIIEKNNAGAILYKLDSESYRGAVQKIDSLIKEDHQGLFLRINKLAVQYRSFDIAERVYNEVYGQGF